MIQDFKFALRQLIKAPGFSIAAVIVLALGIGANSAVFSLVYAMLFQPPGYARPAEVVQVYSQDKKNPENFRLFSYPTYRDIKESNTVFSDVLAHNLRDDRHRREGEHAPHLRRRRQRELLLRPRRCADAWARVPAGRGNAWPACAGRGHQPQLLEEAGSKPGILGSEIIINSRPFTVVGIMPEGFTGTMHIVGCGSVAAVKRARAGDERLPADRRSSALTERGSSSSSSSAG